MVQVAVNNVNYACPACGGPLAFDTKLQKLACPYCDSSYTTQEVEEYFAAQQAKAEAKAAAQAQEQGAAAQADGAAAAGEGISGQAGAGDWFAASSDADEGAADGQTRYVADPIQAFLDSKKPLAQDDEHATAVECSSCGATMIVSDVSAVTKCPYCGNNAIVPGKLGSTLKPDLIIPFKNTKKDAVAALNAHYAGKICLPKAFKDGNHVEEIQGVYVPFWLYSGTATGSAKYTCTDTRTWSDSDYNYTETSTYYATREGSCSFDKIPADASKRMPDDHMDSIESYDYNAFEPFSMAYLPGFSAERYDQSANSCVKRATHRMQSTLEDELRNSVVGHMNVMQTSSTCSNEVSDVKYALLPVWMLHTRWEDKDFLFAMNGQTGKLVGDLPLDKKKLNLISLAVFAASFAITFAAAAFFMLS